MSYCRLCPEDRLESDRPLWTTRLEVSSTSVWIPRPQGVKRLYLVVWQQHEVSKPSCPPFLLACLLKLVSDLFLSFLILFMAPLSSGLGLRTSTSTQLQLPWGKNYSTRVKVIQRSWRIVNNKAWNALVAVVFALLKLIFRPRVKMKPKTESKQTSQRRRVGKLGIEFCWSIFRSLANQIAAIVVTCGKSHPQICTRSDVMYKPKTS